MQKYTPYSEFKFLVPCKKKKTFSSASYVRDYGRVRFICPNLGLELLCQLMSCRVSILPESFAIFLTATLTVFLGALASRKNFALLAETGDLEGKLTKNIHNFLTSYRGYSDNENGFNVPSNILIDVGGLFLFL